MSDLADQLKAINAQISTQHLPPDDPNKRHALFVDDAHRAWLRLPESERAWTPEALEYASQSMAGGFKHQRSKRISPSSIGEGCGRLILFGYGGHPQTPFPVRNQDLMDQGTFLHLKWQMEGLSAGWLTECEVWVHNEELRCGGSADGLLADGGLFELKTVGAGLYTRYSRSPNPDHLQQMETYWEVDSRGERRFKPIGSLVYVNRENGAYTEHRIVSNPERRKQVVATLEDLHDWIDLNDLPDMLEVCKKRSSQRYLDCQYHATCPTAQGVLPVAAVEEQG